jgi:hypothetical protein
VRIFLKNQIVNFARKVLMHDRGRRILDESLGNRLDRSPGSAVCLASEDSLYADLPQAEAGRAATRLRSDLVFITGRFRSGSTLFWNVFRQLEGFTSFYEPFNERRWFNPDARGDRVDRSHRGVDDYWREYDQIRGLDSFYTEEWIRRELYLDERHVNWPMQRYIEEIISQSPGRPVLQFNRIDLRLPWFRRTFPNGTILHITRHPRDQWCSTLMDIQRFGPESGTLEDFKKHDGFYLTTWVNDLKYWFPFLDDHQAHPYRHFYFIWRLSQLFGASYSDLSLRFEDLVHNPHETLGKVFKVLDYQIEDWRLLDSLLKPPVMEKWKRYAPDDWFRQHEQSCENVLADFFGWEQNSDFDVPSNAVVSASIT